MSKILEACRRGDHASLATITKSVQLKHNINLVNEKGQTGLMLACENNRIGMVQLLITFKVESFASSRLQRLRIRDKPSWEPLNLDTVDKDGNSALHYACIRGFDTIVEMLISATAKLDIPNKKGITPFMYAVYERKFPIAIQLINHGVTIENTYENGYTPLIYACLFGNQLLVEILLRKDASVNHQGNNGNTALHYAINSGFENTIYMELLKHGANPNLKNNNGKNIFDIMDEIEGPGFHVSHLLVHANNRDVKFSIRKNVSEFVFHPSNEGKLWSLDKE